MPHTNSSTGGVDEEGNANNNATALLRTMRTAYNRANAMAGAQQSLTAAIAQYPSHYKQPSSITVPILEALMRRVEVGTQLALGEADAIIMAVLALQQREGDADDETDDRIAKGEGSDANMHQSDGQPFQSIAMDAATDNNTTNGNAADGHGKPHHRRHQQRRIKRLTAPILDGMAELLRAVTMLAAAVRDARAAVFYYNPFIHGRSARLLYLLVDLSVLSYGPLVTPDAGSNSASAVSEHQRQSGGGCADSQWAKSITHHANGSAVSFLIARLISMVEEVKSSVIVYDERSAAAADADGNAEKNGEGNALVLGAADATEPTDAAAPATPSPTSSCSSPSSHHYDPLLAMGLLNGLVGFIEELSGVAEAEEHHIRAAVMGNMYECYGGSRGNTSNGGSSGSGAGGFAEQRPTRSSSSLLRSGEPSSFGGGGGASDSRTQQRFGGGGNANANTANGFGNRPRAMTSGIAIGGGGANNSNGTINTTINSNHHHHASASHHHLPLADTAAPNCRKLSYRGVLEDRVRCLYLEIAKLPPFEILSSAGGLSVEASLHAAAAAANINGGGSGGATAPAPKPSSSSPVGQAIHQVLVEELGAGGMGEGAGLGFGASIIVLGGGGNGSSATTSSGGGTQMLDLQALWTRAMSRWGLHGLMGRGCVNYLSWWVRQATVVLRGARASHHNPLNAYVAVRRPPLGPSPSDGEAAVASGSPLGDDGADVQRATTVTRSGRSPVAALPCDAPIPAVKCDVLDAFQAFVSALDLVILDRVIVNKCAVVQDLIHYLGIKGLPDTRLQLDRLLDDSQREMQLFSHLAAVQRVVYPAAAYALARAHRVNEAESWAQMLPREVCPPVARTIKEYCRILRCTQTPADVLQVLRRIDRHYHAVMTTTTHTTATSGGVKGSSAAAHFGSTTSTAPGSPLGSLMDNSNSGGTAEDAFSSSATDTNPLMGSTTRSGGGGVHSSKTTSRVAASNASASATVVGAMLLIERVIEHYLGVATSSAVAMRDAIDHHLTRNNNSSNNTSSRMGASPPSNGSSAVLPPQRFGAGGAAHAFGSTPPVLAASAPSSAAAAAPSSFLLSSTNAKTLLSSTNAKTLPQDASLEQQRAALMSVADDLIKVLTDGVVRSCDQLFAVGIDGAFGGGCDGDDDANGGNSAVVVNVSDEDSSSSSSDDSEVDDDATDGGNEKAKASTMVFGASASTATTATDGGNDVGALASFGVSSSEIDGAGGPTPSSPLGPSSDSHQKKRQKKSRVTIARQGSAAVDEPLALTSSMRLPSRRNLLATLSPLFRRHALHVISSYVQRFTTSPCHWHALEHDSRITLLQHRALSTAAAGGGNTDTVLSKRLAVSSQQQQQQQLRSSPPLSAISTARSGGPISPDVRPAPSPKVGLFSGFVKFLFGDDDEKNTNSTNANNRRPTPANNSFANNASSGNFTASSSSTSRYFGRSAPDTAPSELRLHGTFHLNGSSAGDSQQRMEQKLSLAPSVLLYNFKYMSEGGAVESLSQHTEGAGPPSLGGADALTSGSFALSSGEDGLSGNGNGAGDGSSVLYGVRNVGGMNAHTLNRPEGLSRHEEAIRLWSMNRAREVERRLLTPLHISRIKWELLPEVLAMAEQFGGGGGGGTNSVASKKGGMGAVLEQCAGATTSASSSSPAAAYSPVVGHPPSNATAGFEGEEDAEEDPIADARCTYACCLDIITPLWEHMQTLALQKERAEEEEEEAAAAKQKQAQQQQRPRLTASAAAAMGVNPFTGKANNVNGPKRMATTNTNTMASLLMVPTMDDSAVATMTTSTSAFATGSSATRGGATMTADHPFARPGDELMPRLWAVRCMDPSTPHAIVDTAADVAVGAASPTASELMDASVTFHLREEAHMRDSPHDSTTTTTAACPPQPSSNAAAGGSSSSPNAAAVAASAVGTSLATIHGHPTTPQAAAFIISATTHLTNASCCHRLASSAVGGHGLVSAPLASAYTALSVLDTTLWSLCDVVLGDNAALHLKRALHGLAHYEATSASGTDGSAASFGAPSPLDGGGSGSVGVDGGAFDATKSFVPSVQLQDQPSGMDDEGGGGMYRGSSHNTAGSASGIGSGASGSAFGAPTSFASSASPSAQRQALIRKLATTAFLFRSPDTMLPNSFRRAIHRRLPPFYQLQDWRNVYSTNHHGVSLSRLLAAGAEEAASLLVLKVRPAAESSQSTSSYSSSCSSGGADGDDDDEESFFIGAFFAAPLKMHSRTYHGSGETFVFRFPPSSSVCGVVGVGDAAQRRSKRKQQRVEEMSALYSNHIAIAAAGRRAVRSRQQQQGGAATSSATAHLIADARGRHHSRRGLSHDEQQRFHHVQQSAPRHFEFWHWAHTNEYFVNCRQGEMLAVGGPTPAIYLDESLSRGSTSACRTFGSPALTAPPLCTTARRHEEEGGSDAVEHRGGDDDGCARDLDVLAVELYGFGWSTQGVPPSSGM